MATFGTSVGVYTRGNPAPEFVPLVMPELQAQLSIAIVEMAFGDISRTAPRAAAAGLPSRISVYIDTGTLPPSRASQLRSWAEEGVREWDRAQISVPIDFIDSPTRATTVIRFVDRLVVDGRRMAGFIEWTRRVIRNGGGSNLEVRSLIRVSNRFSNGSLMSEGQIKKVVAHEFGHLLGLADDDCSKSLMGPVGPHADGIVPDSAVQAVAELRGRSQEVVAAAQQVRPESKQPRIFVFAK